MNLDEFYSKYKPKSSCLKCYGRGYIGKNQDEQYVACKCCKPIELPKELVDASGTHSDY